MCVCVSGVGGGGGGEGGVLHESLQVINVTKTFKQSFSAAYFFIGVRTYEWIHRKCTYERQTEETSLYLWNHSP